MGSCVTKQKPIATAVIDINGNVTRYTGQFKRLFPGKRPTLFTMLPQNSVRAHRAHLDEAMKSGVLPFHPTIAVSIAQKKMHVRLSLLSAEKSILVKIFEAPPDTANPTQVLKSVRDNIETVESVIATSEIEAVDRERIDRVVASIKYKLEKSNMIASLQGDAYIPSIRNTLLQLVVDNTLQDLLNNASVTLVNHVNQFIYVLCDEMLLSTILGTVAHHMILDGAEKIMIEYRKRQIFITGDAELTSLMDPLSKATCCRAAELMGASISEHKTQQVIIDLTRTRRDDVVVPLDQKTRTTLRNVLFFSSDAEECRAVKRLIVNHNVFICSNQNDASHMVEYGHFDLIICKVNSNNSAIDFALKVRDKCKCMLALSDNAQGASLAEKYPSMYVVTLPTNLNRLIEKICL